MLERISLLRNIGQFDSVDAGSCIKLNKLTLIYGENGRGKTTLAAILRSLSTGNPIIINERQRLPENYPPHVILTDSKGEKVIFENGEWTKIIPDILLFDDTFVAENIYSGIDVSHDHRENLHDLIIGAQGVNLNDKVRKYEESIEKHNAALRAKSSAIPSIIRGSLTADQFCALEKHINIDQELQDAERNLGAARAADAVQAGKPFAIIALRNIDLPGIQSLLMRGLSEIENSSIKFMQDHFAILGGGSENWVEKGLNYINSASSNLDQSNCPFCTQDISNSSIILHYKNYFSKAYGDLKDQITTEIDKINELYNGDARAEFERAVSNAIQCRKFWANYIDIPDFDLDTHAIAEVWKLAIDHLILALNAKQGAPLDQVCLSDEILKAIEAYNQLCVRVGAVNDKLQEINDKIAQVKKSTEVANVANLSDMVEKLKAVKARYSIEMEPLCIDYLNEKNSKVETEKLRNNARNSLNEYREKIFPTYEDAINKYLGLFNADFRIIGVKPTNVRGGSTCTYNILINNVQVPLSNNDIDGRPSFRSVLSGGDRNALALAFFFSVLEKEEKDAQLSNKMVVIDDPMSSLDEHRSNTTIRQVIKLLVKSEQVIVLSHNKSFLCAIWEECEKMSRVALQITRDQKGSTLKIWDVNKDCITENDRRHELVWDYIQLNNSKVELEVAMALRFILEAYIRVCYPRWFGPGLTLGVFLGKCRQKESELAETILNETAMEELSVLLTYANQFHHDTNPAWKTTNINDRELKSFCERTLKFVQK